MSQLASRAQFHGGEQTSALYTDYRRFPFFAQRAEWIKAHYPDARTVLVVGCAYGYLVDELRDRGVEAWGIEASEYAVWRARREIGRRARYVLRGDATVPADLARCCTDALATPFDLVVTEDVLPACSDAEVVQLLGSVRIVAERVVHIITPGDPADEHRNPSLNWKPTAVWKAIVEPDVVLDAETWESL